MGDAAASLEALRQELEALKARLGGSSSEPAAARRAAVLERVTSLCIRYTGDTSQGVAQHALAAPAELCHFANNPVPRPP